MAPSVRHALALAEEAFTNMEFEDALRFADQALELEPDSIQALDLRGSVLMALGEWEAADGVFARLRELEPRNIAWVLAAADALIRLPGDDRERIEAGLDLLDEVESQLERDEDLHAAADLLRGVGLNQLGECEHALDALEQALLVDPENAEARLERGIALFELARFDQAKKAFVELARDDDEAWAHHYLGLIAERRREDAERHFSRARELEPEEFPAPIRLSAAEFDAAVSQAVANLPDHAKPHLANVIFDVQPIPTDDELREGGVSPTILGIFRGVPIDERLDLEAAHHQTAHITLYQANLERFAHTRDELLEEIGVTVLHEVGHLMGLDEDELYDRGLD